MYIVLHKNIRTITFLTANQWGGYKNDITNVVDSVWIDRCKTKAELLNFLRTYDLAERYDIVKTESESYFVNNSITLSCSDGDESIVEFTIIEI